MKEIKTNEMGLEQIEETFEEFCESNDNPDIYIDSNRSVGRMICGVILAVGGAGYYFWMKNKDKYETKKIDKMIGKMEKLGYTVTKNETTSDEVEGSNDSDVEETTEE